MSRSALSALTILLLSALGCRPSHVADHEVSSLSAVEPLPAQDPTVGTEWGPTEAPGTTDSTGGTDSTEDTGTTGTDTSFLGFVGSPCAVDADCAYEGGACLLPDDGYPLGTCSVACDRHCPDAVGYPTTFCVDRIDLPMDTPELGEDGVCLSRCDFEAYPVDGCRQGYGCTLEPRANEPGTEMWTCMPQKQKELTPCLDDLARRGVPFQPTLIEDQVAADSGGQVCVVDEPVVVQSGYQGIDIIYYDGQEPGSVNAACEMAQALADTMEDLAVDGVTTLRHLGTTNCRVISGTSTVSQHGYGLAIDLYGYDFADGRAYTYVDDWQHDARSSEAGLWLYDTVYGWHHTWIWNTLLTPDYDNAHDNHVHADMKPGNGFIGATDHRVFAPMEGNE